MFGLITISLSEVKLRCYSCASTSIIKHWDSFLEKRGNKAVLSNYQCNFPAEVECEGYCFIYNVTGYKRDGTLGSLGVVKHCSHKWYTSQEVSSKYIHETVSLRGPGGIFDMNTTTHFCNSSLCNVNDFKASSALEERLEDAQLTSSLHFNIDGLTSKSKNQQSAISEKELEQFLTTINTVLLIPESTSHSDSKNPQQSALVSGSTQNCLPNIMFVIILLLTVVGVANGRLNDDSSAEEISKEMNFEMPAMPPPFMDRRPRPHIRIFTFKPDHFSTPRLPPFLHSASEGTKKRFHEIFSNQTLTFAEKKAQIDQLIEGENDAVKAEFAKFKKTMEERKQKIEQQHKEAVSKLSKEAQEADAKIIQLFKNESLTHSDRRQMMREIFEHLPKNVRDELNTLRPHNRFGGRFGKC
uniref:DUF148 domain-containing protein n=1 Tax=Syphacia muris TaxID=451379 RepID=A0A0N5ANY3_9BILA